MTRTHFLTALLAIGAALLAPTAMAKRLPAIHGRSIQIDPNFPYYQNRSRDSIAREMQVNGFKIVRYVITDDSTIDDELIEAFHRRGIAVWYQTGGNGFYSPGNPEPPNWQMWRMVHIGTVTDDSYKFMSMSHPDYIAWKKAKVVAVARNHAFDGIEIAEPFQMSWGGPENAYYGDFHPEALKAFTAFSGYAEPPDFKYPTSPRYYKTDTVRYRKWQDFRVHAANAFINEIVNGPGGLRESVPGIPFCAWSLANTSPIAGRDPADVIREWQGMDAVEIARTVKPDMICIQTNWPDWITPELPGNYPLQYKSFADPLKAAFPDMPYIIQADIGSLQPMRRSREWIAAFEAACKDIGAVGNTAYMYDLALWMYTEPPKVKRVEADRTEITLIFQKCVNPASATRKENYTIIGPDGQAVTIRRAVVDGNLVKLITEPLKRGRFYALSYRDVKDEPGRWFVRGQADNTGRGTMQFRVR